MNTYLYDGRDSYNESGDCSVIALSYTLNIDYSKAHFICSVHGRKNNKGFTLSKVFIKKYGERLNDKEFIEYFIGKKIFRITYHTRPHMSVKRFKLNFSKGIYILRVGGHIFCMKDSVIFNNMNDNAKISYYHEIKEIE